MGEFADDAHNRAFVEVDQYENWVDGLISDGEAYELGIIDAVGTEIGDPKGSRFVGEFVRDVFEHDVTAFENMLDKAGNPVDGDFTWGKSSFKVDPLYYHTKVKFNRIKAETKRSYLFSFSNSIDIWVPKKVCRELKEDSVYIHINTLRKIVEGLQ